MAILAPLIAFIGRQLGRLVQMVFGWATLMLFGRVPQSKQLLLAGVSAGCARVDRGPHRRRGPRRR